MERRPRIRDVEPLAGTRVKLAFTTGEIREVDLAPYLRGPVFDAVRSDPNHFRAMRVDAELGTIVWPDGADIDPDVLYEGLTPAWQDSTEAA
jgi:hypothetical protein